MTSLYYLMRATATISLRRLLSGPQFPNWSWDFETATLFLKQHFRYCYDLPDISKSRECLDALVFYSPALERVTITWVDEPVRGAWFVPENDLGRSTVLHFHGGGFAYFAKSHASLIAEIALAARSQVFALDYRLIPEHAYPAQLQDALAAYRWLLETGPTSNRLVVSGDSAGGNLCLALLLSLKDDGLPLPAVGICISPWTDIGNPGESMLRHEPFDWPQKRMADQWSSWYRAGEDPGNPLLSPNHANLHGLPPLYLQAGGVEILLDMINEFAAKAKREGSEVVLEVWENMNHEFQAYGDLVPEARAALDRIGQVVSRYTE